MTAAAYFLVNVDTDPDPDDTPRNDHAVLAKYNTMKGLIGVHANGKAAVCVMTGPLYRDRFFGDPFLGFFRDWAEDGADLVLHPEEDLYGTPSSQLEDGVHYSDTAYMSAVITDQVQRMAHNGLTFAAYKGGYHGLTTGIVSILKRTGISMDLTCAPGIHWPAREAHWANAPLTAFYLSENDLVQPASPDEENPLFEIPFGWDGAPSDTGRLLNEHYLVNEFSTYEAMTKVWDTIAARSDTDGRPHVVSLLCHTFTMDQAPYRERLAAILDYMTAHGGVPVTASEAKALYDAGDVHQPSSNSPEA